MKLREVIKEGGNQMTKTTQGRIPMVEVTREQVKATIKALSDLTGIPEHDLHVVGSAGKQQSSKDIDVVIDTGRYNIEKIHEVVKYGIMRMIEDQSHGEINVKEHNIAHTQKGKKGFHMASYAFPIAGDVNNGFVQVDLIPTANVGWLTFSMNSPGEKSAYKGAIRNILLGCAAATMYDPKLDKFIEDPKHGYLLKVRRQFDIKKGLHRVFQLRKKTREGGYKKDLEDALAEEIIGVFPEMQDFNMDQNVITDPNKAIQLIFNDTGLSMKHVETAEQVLSLIKSRLPHDRQKKTFELARNWFSRLKNMNVPPI